MNIRHRLEQFYQRHRDALNPPLSANEKSSLLEHIPNIPELILEILSVFNGEIQQAKPVNGEAFFMSSTDIIEHYHMFCDELSSFTDEEMEIHHPEDHPIEVQQTLVNKLWFPFMHYNGDVYFLDMNPTEHGNLEQVFLINIAQGCDLFELIAKSRNDFLQKFCFRFEL